MAYLIKKDEKTKEIIRIDYEIDGYEFKPKLKGENYLQINQVTIINPSLIEKILAIKFNKVFHRLATLGFNILQSEDDEEASANAYIVLNEIERMKTILRNKYAKFLKEKKELEFYNKLVYLESELRMKQILINQKMFSDNLDNQKGRSK